MKNALLLALFMFVGLNLAFCQWTSPGNGTVYTMHDLLEASQGCVTYEDTLSAYLIHSNLTITANDCLKVTETDCLNTNCDAIGIYSVGNILITIQGSINIDNEKLRVYFLPFTESNHLRFAMENSTTPSFFKNTTFYETSGIQINESAVRFDSCYFQNTSMGYQRGAITYKNCDPVLNDCIFQGNYGPALYSDGESKGSPQITRCEFRYNVLSKENMPQLDLGPGGEDTIRIVNSRVLGLYPLVGGIRIADTMQAGDTKILLKGNFIGDNRYGFLQQGYAIESFITDNEIICSNMYESDPMTGGWGINIIGATNDCKAIIRHNLIKNNLWGITIHDNAVADLGTEENHGDNRIFNNHNNCDSTDRHYALYVYGVNDVSAIGNYWGGTTEAFAESVIYHRPDLGEDIGLVTYSPILIVNDWAVTAYKPSESTAFPNPTNGLVTLRVNQAEGFTYEVFNMMGQRVMNGHANGQETVIDLGPFSTGIYAIAIKADHEKTFSFLRIIR